MTRMATDNATQAASSPQTFAASPSVASTASTPLEMGADASQWPSGHSTLSSTAAGVSLKPQHYRDILSNGSTADFFEVHAENYFGPGGAPHRYLTAMREQFALSIHGIGLSIGSAGPLDRAHLAQLRALVNRYEPALVSEHLAWCENGGAYFNDLLPVALTEEALNVVCRHVDQTQEALGRRVLIENPSNYLVFESSIIPETEFLSEMAQRTGCGLLLDINNVVVSAHNVEFDAHAYVDAFDHDAVCEMHMAGHATDQRGSTKLKIDDHGSAPTQDVWALYTHFVEIAGARPTLVEWDQDVPELGVLEAEATKARTILQRGKTAAGADVHREAANVPAL